MPEVSWSVSLPFRELSDENGRVRLGRHLDVSGAGPRLSFLVVVFVVSAA
jgi:hypothetical protein